MSSKKTYHSDPSAIDATAIIGADDTDVVRSSGHPAIQHKQNSECDETFATGSEHIGLQQSAEAHSYDSLMNEKVITHSQSSRIAARSSPKWQYSTTNNVKTLHSIEDAKEYTKDLADIWELQRYQNGKEFVGMLLRALDQREHPEIAYDYAFTNAQGGDYYILVIIRKYADRIAICSSYQEMTLVSVAYSGVALSEHKLISWLKENASRSLEAHTKV
ncbi:unnamed protein product, partial [Rotaria sp. Silwood2]